ncbi:lysophospholipid acyltransferase family protein [Polaribacter porphyrae]|uniref:Lipid A biosynthesis acyltransferase n=1 Tax=Polaribacter porphyrae TaxID=1137780 RepID=A0A2S7WMF8_9FLAO|nr:lysophospholipid acyltransferase family protein [Polaribacter porphyrae]PQJ78769.1 lipid A biosynthesis acyltransferase [Polaribacter porphyrae]
MQFLVFVFTYPFFWLFSRLPMKVLNIKSDILFLLIYYVIGYRKEVVLENLKLAFPEKSIEDRKKIARYFFKHFTDLFIETIKAISISEQEILKRYKYKNPELVNNLLKDGKSIAFVSAHHANWEWSVNSPLVLDSKVNGAYTSIGNKYFDKIVKQSRERFGFVCYESSKTVKAILKDYKNKKQGIYLLISDQSPQLEHTLYWQKFFGIKVPFHIGAETLAKKFNLAVVYCDTTKVKRGFYETEFKLIAENPKDFDDYKITDAYIRLTEETVKKQPECYLWSHKRFKHKDRFEEWKTLKAAKKSKK